VCEVLSGKLCTTSPRFTYFAISESSSVSEARVRLISCVEGSSLFSRFAFISECLWEKETNLRKAILQTGQRSSGLHHLFALVQFYEVLGTGLDTVCSCDGCCMFISLVQSGLLKLTIFYAEKEGKQSFNVFPVCLLSTCSWSACALVVHKKGCLGEC